MLRGVIPVGASIAGYGGADQSSSVDLHNTCAHTSAPAAMRAVANIASVLLPAPKLVSRLDHPKIA